MSGGKSLLHFVKNKGVIEEIPMGKTMKSLSVYI